MYIEIGSLWLNNCCKGLTVYKLNCKKCSYLPYTLQCFVTTAKIFFDDFILWAATISLRAVTTNSDFQMGRNGGKKVRYWTSLKGGVSRKGVMLLPACQVSLELSAHHSHDASYQNHFFFLTNIEVSIATCRCMPCVYIYANWQNSHPGIRENDCALRPYMGIELYHMVQQWFGHNVFWQDLGSLDSGVKK